MLVSIFLEPSPHVALSLGSAECTRSKHGAPEIVEVGGFSGLPTSRSAIGVATAMEGADKGPILGSAAYNPWLPMDQSVHRWCGPGRCAAEFGCRDRI